MKCNHLFSLLFAVPFLGTAFFPYSLNLLGAPENVRFLLLAYISLIMFLLVITKKKNYTTCPGPIICSFILAVVLISLLFRFKLQWINYVKILSLFCLFVSFYYSNIETKRHIAFLMPVISILICVFLILAKFFLPDLFLQESLWFDNIAGPMMIISIGYSFVLPLIDHRLLSMRIVFSLVAIIHIVVTIIFGSRTALLSMIVTSLIYLFYFTNHDFNKTANVIIVLIIIFSAIFFIIILIKKSDSSNGRILIWRVTLKASTDRIFLGHGPGSYISKYMLYQAKYLEDCTNIHYATIAGNIYHPFNELILVLFQNGLFGVSLLTSAMSYILYKMIKAQSITILSAISLFIFSFFSYPSKYAFFWVVLMYVISDSKLYSVSRINIHNNKILTFISFCIPISLFLVTTSDLLFNIKWRNCYNNYIHENNESLKTYAKLAQYWNHDPSFLYNWAVANYKSFNYETCINILNKCIIWLNDYNVQMLYGECYESIECYDDALFYFETCNKMCPSLLMPEYKIFEIYKFKKDFDNAKAVGEHILNRQLKIENATTKAIKENVTNFLEQVSAKYTTKGYQFYTL